MSPDFFNKMLIKKYNVITKKTIIVRKGCIIS